MRPLFKAAYSASEKLSADGSGGLDIRQFGGGAGDRVNPVWEFGVTYLPMEATAIRINAYRRIEGAASMVGTDYTLTGVGVQITRTLLQRYELELANGYERSDYHSITPSPVFDRHDNYFYVRPALRAVLSRNLNINAFCQYRKNTTQPDSYGFDNVQVGLSLGYDY